MDIVALRDDKNKIYSIQQFVMMSEIERDKFRENIVCEECGGDAYYRRATKDGKTACFAASHILPCDTASGNKSSKNSGGDETNEIESGQDFEIFWNYSNRKVMQTEESEEETDLVVKKNKKKYILKPSIEKKGKIGLASILKYAEYDILEKQTYNVNIPGVGLKKLKDIVVNLKDVNDIHLNKNLFLWGNIYSFKSNWLNTSYDNNIGIRVNESIQERFWTLYRDRFVKLLHDKKCLIIIFGKVGKSKAGKYFIRLNEMKYFYIRKSKR